LLLKKGYEVHGILRRSSSFNTARIEHIYQDPHVPDRKLRLHYGDMTDASALSRLIERIQPHEIYHLAAQSHVQVSFEVPEYTAETDAVGTLRLLDAIKDSGVKTRFYQASTSELFGKVQQVPQSERTPFYPRSLMRQPSSMRIGSPSTTARRTGSTPPMGFSSTTRAPVEARPSSRARSPARRRTSSSGSKSGSTSATFQHSVIGAMRQSTSKRCG
jgi:hypothetical protein